MSKNHLSSLKAESKAFKRLDGDFVVKAMYTFTHQNYICFVMEYMNGGDFTSILEGQGYLDEEVARFYIAELILAVHSLHEIGIVHRDLKPDNILVDSKGHIKLTDFGLSEVGLSIQKSIATPTHVDDQLSTLTTLMSNRKKATFNKLCDPSKFSQKTVQFVQRSNGRSSPSTNLADSSPKTISSGRGGSCTTSSASCSPERVDIMKENKPARENKQSNDSEKRSKVRIIGTPDYIAPEVLEGVVKPGTAIDWWSVGVILYELVVGLPPFNDETRELVFENILNMKMQWPTSDDGKPILSADIHNLISSFLNKDPSKRLGSNGIQEIKSHAFFKGKTELFLVVTWL